MASISELLQGCLTQFVSIINSGALSDHTADVPLQGWMDELGRLRVWAANIGAHQTRQSSLDYRLRDASHIKGQILRLLGRSRDLLMDLKDVLEEDNDDEAQDDGLHDFEDLKDILSSEMSTTEIQEIHQGLTETINQLYQMSMIIRQPAQHDRLVGTQKVDSEPFQFWAKQHTSNKYPNADSLAIDRISSAMARQRAILKYRERHHAKLSQGLYSEGDGKSTILSETVVTEVFQEIPSQTTDTAFDAVSETSYGGTLLEGTGADAPKIPPIPKKGREQSPFECPFCFYIITVRDKKAWARHIFRDLMPYVCIFPGCSTPDKLYGGRRQWHHHIQQAHAPTPTTDGTYDCPICKQGPLPTATFQRHVGQHLEELALFLLPRTESDEDDIEETDDELSNVSMDDNSVERGVEQNNSMDNAAAPASASSDPISFQTNVNRAKEKRWVEAKEYSYDGGDWGSEEDEEEQEEQPLAPAFDSDPGEKNPPGGLLNDPSPSVKIMINAEQRIKGLKKRDTIQHLERELDELRGGTVPHFSPELHIEDEDYAHRLSPRLSPKDSLDDNHSSDDGVQMKPRHTKKLAEAIGDRAERAARLEETDGRVEKKLHETIDERGQVHLEVIAKEQEEQEERLKLIEDIKEEERLRAAMTDERRKEAAERYSGTEIRRKDAGIEEKRERELAMKAAAGEEWKLEQERIKQRVAKGAKGKKKSEMGSNNKETEDMIHEDKNDGKTEKKTWIKVHRRHLLPETLIAFNLPWDWDELNPEFILIKQWVTEDIQEELFAHSRRLRADKVTERTEGPATETKVNQRKRDKIFLRRRSKRPARSVENIGQEP